MKWRERGRDRTETAYLAEVAEPFERIDAVLGFGPEEVDKRECRLLRLTVERLELGSERAQTGVGDGFRVAV